MYLLPLVSLILGLFVLSALALAGLIIADRVTEQHSRPQQQDPLQLSLESLIQELTATA